eukprot:CAMPEP_0181505826 /NCGR_PEP_ID=MMETSP1110-20121109/58265_1 /TAXON_ID=174948 /ORGANISM="Symbiodinium sp., Strain CCMP421" /LENGTH=48 /DNA_ID= /DNA_START= /DNA_END= /DNA_ORIENTATION=
MKRTTSSNKITRSGKNQVLKYCMATDLGRMSKVPSRSTPTRKVPGRSK